MKYIRDKRDGHIRDYNPHLAELQTSEVFEVEGNDPMPDKIPNLLDFLRDRAAPAAPVTVVVKAATEPLRGLKV